MFCRYPFVMESDIQQSPFNCCFDILVIDLRFIWASTVICSTAAHRFITTSFPRLHRFWNDVTLILKANNHSFLYIWKIRSVCCRCMATTIATMLYEFLQCLVHTQQICKRNIISVIDYLMLTSKVGGGHSNVAWLVEYKQRLEFSNV